MDACVLYVRRQRNFMLIVGYDRRFINPYTPTQLRSDDSYSHRLPVQMCP